MPGSTTTCGAPTLASPPASSLVLEQTSDRACYIASIMTSARKTKLIVKHHPPRNPLVVPALQRKAGAHLASRKQRRQQEERALRRELQRAAR